MTRDLAVRLLARPHAPETNQALQEYLSGPASEAAAAFSALMEQGPEQLQQRINEILRASSNLSGLPCHEDDDSRETSGSEEDQPAPEHDGGTGGRSPGTGA